MPNGPEKEKRIKELESRHPSQAEIAALDRRDAEQRRQQEQRDIEERHQKVVARVENKRTRLGIARGRPAAESVSPETYRQNPSAYRPFQDKHGQILHRMEKDRYGKDDHKHGWGTRMHPSNIAASIGILTVFGPIFDR